MNLNGHILNWCSSFSGDEHDLQNRIMFIRDYGDNVIKLFKEGNIKSIKNEADVYVHNFSLDKMPLPYEPFLDYIKFFYDKYYAAGMSADEFVTACGVYFLQREVFGTYLEGKSAVRREPVVISEVKFEQSMLVKSIINCMRYVSDHKSVLVINNFQYSSLSSLNLILELISKAPVSNLKILCVFNDNDFPASYCQSTFDNIVSFAEERNITLDYEDSDQNNTMHTVSFIPNPDNLKEYNEAFNNYYHFLALDDMDYYMDIVHNKIVGDNIQIGNHVAFGFYFYFALCALLRGNDDQATIMCEYMTTTYDKQKEPEKDFQYNYVNCKIHIFKNQVELAMKYVKQCGEIADKLNNEALNFLTEVLNIYVQFGGWKNLFVVDFTLVKSSDEVIAKLKKNGFYNTLAYYLVYGFDNTESALDQIANGNLTDTYKQAFELINKIGNNELLLSAYTKYITLLNSYGYHQVIDRFYEYKLEVLKREENKRRMANLFMGRGYNSSINERFDDAEKSFCNAIDILIELKRPEQIAESFYNMTMNCICAEDFETAKLLMNMLFKIMSNLDLKALNVCSSAKLYCLQAIAYLETGNDYRAFLNLKKVKRLVDIKIASNNNLMYLHKNPQEDLYLYYLISGIIDIRNGNIEQSKKEFEIAYSIFDSVAGLVFYTVTILVIEYYDVLMLMGLNKQASEMIKESIEYCDKNNFKYKRKIIENHIKGIATTPISFKNDLSSEKIDELIELSYNVGMEKQYMKQKKNIRFLSSWQEILNHDFSSEKEMMPSAMNTFQDTFNFDNMIYIDIHNYLPKTSFTNFNFNEKFNFDIMEFFMNNRKEFLINCTDNSYQLYEPFFNTVANENTYTIIGIPVYNEKELVSMFVASVSNQNNNISILTNDDLSIMRTAVIQLHNATERIKNKANMVSINKKLNELAVTDLLTGLYNRQGMEKILDYHSADKENVAIMYIDLDNFKFYNDNFGHDAGDMILKDFAKMFKHLAKNVGDVIRYGGDEFLILLYGHDIDDATEIAKKIYVKIKQNLVPNLMRYVGEDAQIPPEKMITCSIGITETDNTNEAKIFDALKKADEALYNIKKTTKGNYCILKND